MKATLQIGDLARLLGITPKTVRHYHKLGLLAEPKRSEGGYRLYTPDDLLRMQHIRQLQALGLSLAEIGDLLHAPDGDARLRDICDDLLEKLSAEIETLERRKSRIEQLKADGLSLKAVRQPNLPSPTLEQMRGVVGDVELPPDVVAFDEQLFAHIDSFQWSTNLQAMWLQTARGMADITDIEPFLQRFGEQFAALADAPADDPRIGQWAAEWKRGEFFAALMQIQTDCDAIPPQERFAIEHLLEQQASELLSPGQKALLMALGN